VDSCKGWLVGSSCNQRWGVLVGACTLHAEQDLQLGMLPLRAADVVGKWLGLAIVASIAVASIAVSMRHRSCT
jgi:hypothetical protein